MAIKIPWAKPTFSAKEKKYLMDALESTWVSRGPYTERFENEFKKLNNAKYCLATSNGTTALQLALMALGVGKGDEVIVPGLTFVSPVNMVIAVGAKPVYADIDPQTWCINPSLVEKLITKKTKAIIAVHLYGNVCDMDSLKSMACKRRLALIEDTAEAVFSRYQGKNAGTWGDVGCFSFHAAKTITTGEGGCVLTDKRELFDKMRLMADQGMRLGKRYWHDTLGFNFRITDLQSAIGCGQLENIEKIIADKKRVYQAYKDNLKRENGVAMQSFQPKVDPLVWAVAVKINPSAFRFNRDQIIEKFKEAGIETRPGFYPFSVMPYYKAPALPVAEDVGLNVINLPSYTTLAHQDIDLICKTLKGMKR